MIAWDKTEAALPSSHIFLTAAFGHRQKTVAIPRWFGAAVAVLLALGLVWSLGCTAYVIGHDSLLAAAMSHERDLQYAYEDRVAALQRQLDRSLSQHAQLERTVGTRLDTLTALAGELRRKAGTVETLAGAVMHLAPTGANERQAGTSPPNDAAKPMPPAARESSLIDPGSDRTADRLAGLTETLGTLATGQQIALGRLQRVVSDREARLRAAVDDAGLNLTRFGGKIAEAVGGPFVPLDASAVVSPFERASLTLRATLDEAEKLKTAVDHIPLAMPLGGAPELTSPFGARTDPFLGRPALHTGIDLREGTGTDVHATAPGRVTVAGEVSGYGLMVEIDHGAGLSTRYAHLSATHVAPGDAVAQGASIGLVGATGRATGPHLHYETRIDGEPVDPMRFLQAGHRLAQASAL